MFIMQVMGRYSWISVRPTGGKPYEYATEDEAWRMLRICYPEQVRIEGQARVIESVLTNS